MAEILEGGELRFRLATGSIDLTDPTVRRAISILTGRGFELTEPAQIRPPIDTLSYEGLVELHPVMSHDDYLGKEHFRVYGNELGVTRRTSGLIFGLLVGKRVRYKGEYSGSYPRHHQLEEVVINNREATPLGILPKHLVTPERHRKHTEARAIMASSLIFLAENQEQYLEPLDGFGTEVSKAFSDIVSAVEQKIRTGQQLRFDMA